MRCIFLALALFAFCGASAATNTQYGEPLSPAQTVRIGDLVSDPERYVDRRVKVEGLVQDVCPAKGCWVDIIAAQSTETVRFKVQDDVIVFPATARGKEIVAEGILRKHELNHRAAVRWMRHLAEEKGEAFDPASVTGPMEFYQIEGLGAQVSEAVREGAD